MAVVFFIIVFVGLLLNVIIFSSIKIQVEKFMFSKKENEKAIYDYRVVLKLQFLGKITLIKLIINPEKVKKINKKTNIKAKIQNIDFKKARNNLPNKREIKKIFDKLDIKLKTFHLSLELGTWDVILTSAVVTVLASLIGILLTRTIENYKKEKYEYTIIPIYQNKNIIKLSLNCIFQVKVVHIISIIFTLLRNRKEKVKYERTSYRRSYDYSYERY